MTEWNAAGYSRIAGLQRTMAEEVLARLSLEGAERILDVGCGNGRITAEVAARVPRGAVVGVDASHEMIGFAASHFGPAAHPNLRFLHADARSLPFRSEFDLVISFNALHWVIDQEAALRSIQATLKSGGRAQLRLVPAGERKSLEAVIEETRKSANWNRYFTGFRGPYLHLTPGQYRTLAEGIGLRVDHLHTEAKAWDFDSRAEFLAFGSVTFVEWTRQLPEAERPAFIVEVLDRYQPVAFDRPGEEHFFKFYQMDVTLTRPATAVTS